MDGSWFFVLAALATGLVLRCDSRENRTGGRRNVIDVSVKFQTTTVRPLQNKSSLCNFNITYQTRPVSFGTHDGRDVSQDKSEYQLTDPSTHESMLRRTPRQLNGVSSARHRSRTVTGGNGGKIGTSKRLVGPHVCGQQCCSGWAVAPGLNRCIKPDCQPPCLNRGSCSQPHTCVCRSGFQGLRCEEVAPEQVYIHAGGTRILTPVRLDVDQPQQLDQREPLDRQPAVPSSSGHLQRPATIRPPHSSLTTQTRQSSATSSFKQTSISRMVRRYPEPISPITSNALSLGNGGASNHGPGHLHYGPALQETSGQGTVNSAVSPAANLTSGVNRIKIVFTPMMCRRTCSGGQCSNSCEKGEKTTIFSENHGQLPKSQGFRLFFCQIPCLSGGRCIGQNQCWCPSNSTGKFCHLPAPPPNKASSQAANGNGQNSSTHSVYTLPLSNQEASRHPSLVNVHIEHPPETEVQVHGVAHVKHIEGVLNYSQEGSSHSVQQRSRPASGHGNDYSLNNGHADGSKIGAAWPSSRQNGHMGRCFQETVDGQCGKPLPGLTKQDDCCGSVGSSWGLNKCTDCPVKPAYAIIANGQVECPKGFKRMNFTHCQDVNECLMPGICKHAYCLNTKGSYRCTCKPGYMLDTSRSYCVSDKAVSVAKEVCYRSTSGGICSLPLPQRITKQVCCCSRVGKAWGSNCENCPLPDTDHFREICPAGHGYTYSRSDIQISLRKMEEEEMNSAEQHHTSGSPQPSSTHHTQPSHIPSRPHKPSYSQQPAKPKLSPDEPQVPTEELTQPLPSSGTQTSIHQTVDSQQTGTVPFKHTPNGRDPEENVSFTDSTPLHPDLTEISTPAITSHLKPDLNNKDKTTPSINESTQLIDIDQCLLTPTTCGPGQCVPVQTGYRCRCDPGYQLNDLQTHCIDINECEDNVCGEKADCANTYGSYTCRCKSGFSLVITQNRKFCLDINECDMPNKCPGGECVNTEGSYTCECKTGFTKNWKSQCEDVNECLTLGVCAHGHCTNLQGSYKCVCNSGYQTGPDETSCQDVDECSFRGMCDNGECVNLQGSYSCSCKLGYQVSQSGKACQDINECTSRNACPSGICTNTEGSYICTNCKPGFIKSADGQRCEDIDECAQAFCLDGVCTNTEGSYTCTQCQSGYMLSLDHQRCEDIDECFSASICNNGICLNSEGSYSCSACPTGYLVSPDGELCEDVDECLSPGACPLGLCINTPGSFSCMACDTGYALSSDRVTCEDVDECEDVVSCVGGECTNTPGSFTCSCPTGFEHHQTGCRDVNECVTAGVCGDGNCLNIKGSFLCVCPVGYTQAKDGLGCQDVDECEKGNVCFQGECLNTVGSFQCLCEAGYKFSAHTGDCEDLDECKEYGSDVCGMWHCENTIGSYRCFIGCQPGEETEECDTDECVNETICGEHGFCENTKGSYNCHCYSGYTNSPDFQGCVDINECETSTDYCGEALCENVEGSFLCICPSENEEFDPISNQCHSLRAGLTETIEVPLPSSAPSHGKERKECYYNLNGPNFCQNVLSRNTTKEECCCTVGAGWGDNCDIHPCPTGRAEYDQLCPKGNGVLPVTTDLGHQLFKDADECSMFGPEICKNGICTNHFSSYSCYCQNGYYYDNIRLECVDHDECLEEGACEGGMCVNIAGSFNCFCSPPLVLDSTRHRCISINGSDTFSSSDGLGLDDDIHMDICWRELTDDEMCSSPLIGTRTTYTECCCLHGIAWGKLCAFCPPRSSNDFATLCNLPSRGSDGLHEGPAYEYGPDLAPQGPYGPYWNNYGSLGEEGGMYYDPEAPQTVPLFTDSSSDYDDRQEIHGPVHRPRESPPPMLVDDITDRHDSFEGLQAEECGVLNGCENGRCVRVREGYTCDCFDGFELNLTKMACVDINECEDINDKEALCKNGVCVNTDGSYKCNCLSGFVTSANSDKCVPEPQNMPPGEKEK